MNTRRRYLVVGCGIAGALVTLAVLLGGAAYLFKQHQSTLAQLPDKASPIMIAITDPHSSQTVPAGTPLLVHVDAGSSESLFSLELWANGQIVGVQAAPAPNGTSAFAADFAWTPSDPGNYTLIARGIQANNQGADSDGVIVIVGPSEKTLDESGSVDTGQSIPISNGGGGEGGSIPLPQPPSLPGDSDSIGPAQTWKLSLTDWMFGGPSVLPKAPELTAAPQGCGATLSIHDLSEGEDGFIVFKMTDSAPTLTKVTTLDGQSQLDWLTYTDESYTNENSYMVRAFNGNKVADSNIVFAKGDPADCKSVSSQIPQLSIQLTSLKTDVDADMVYCYKSLNGVDWSRWPTSGFFMPGADGFDIQGQADSLVLNELAGKSLTLDLECWGWVGGELQILGKLHKDDIRPALGNVQLTDGGLVAGLDLGGGIIQTKDKTKAPTDPKMPKVFAIIFHGPNACKEHLPGKGNNFLESALYCSWFPVYNPDEGQSQPYLVWYVSDPQYQQCVDGKGADCNSVDSYLTRAKSYGGVVGFNVYAQFNNAIPQATTPHDRTVFVVPPQNTCGQDVLYLTVRMFYQGGPKDPDYPNQMIESPDSNTITSVFNCPPPSEVKLDVTFDTLHLGDLYDGPLDDDLELFGSLVAEGLPGSGSVLNFGKWGENGPDCTDLDAPPLLPTDIIAPFRTLGSGGNELPECPHYYYTGMSDPLFAATSMCASDTYAHCNGSYSTQNNVIQVTVGDGSKLRVSVHIMDYDAYSLDDTVCQTQTYIGPESNYSWMSYSGSGTLSQGDNGNASCTVYFHVAPSP
jgi:hypothetical protein